MKQVLILLVFNALALSVNGQPGRQFYIQIGAESATQYFAGQRPLLKKKANYFNTLLGIFTANPEAIGNQTFRKLYSISTRSTANFTFGWRRQRSRHKRFNTGFVGSWNQYENLLGWSRGPATRTTEHFLTGLADAQVSWWKSAHLDVYSGVGAGLSLYQMRGDHARNHLLLIGQLNALGVQAHNGPVGAFVQVGVGAHGRVSGGLVARF